MICTPQPSARAPQLPVKCKINLATFLSCLELRNESSAPFRTPKEHYQSSEQFEQQYKNRWSSSLYQVDSPSDDTMRLGSGNQWPSLQIVCTESSPLYQTTDFADAQSMQPQFGSGGSGAEVQRSAMLGAYTGARCMSYYPTTNTGMTFDENPASYRNTRPISGFAYSPAHAPTPGYRSNLYGMPLTPRGGLAAQASPARSPAVNRRFMEPIDGYVYQVCVSTSADYYCLFISTSPSVC